jgi:hypothetical protein
MTKKDELYIGIITSYLAQIHVTLLEIMGIVGNGSATILEHNRVIKDLQEIQSEYTKALNKIK